MFIKSAVLITATVLFASALTALHRVDAASALGSDGPATSSPRGHSSEVLKLAQGPVNPDDPAGPQYNTHVDPNHNAGPQYDKHHNAGEQHRVRRDNRESGTTGRGNVTHRRSRDRDIRM